MPGLNSPPIARLPANWHHFLHLTTKRFIAPYILFISLFFTWGFSYGLIDTLNAYFQIVLRLSHAKSTALQAAYFGLGYLLFAPLGGLILQRYGYKPAVLLGLVLFSLGSVFFWPLAHFASSRDNSSIFAGFVVCTGVLGGGVALLELSSNSYITLMPHSSSAVFRLVVAYGFNGIGQLVGPLIGSKYFFTGANLLNNLVNVEYVYISVACVAAILFVAFVFYTIPTVSATELQVEQDRRAVEFGVTSDPQLLKPFYKQLRPFIGAVAQFFYVGAHTSLSAFFIQFAVEAAGVTPSKADGLLASGLLVFCVFRFVSAAILMVVPAANMLLVNSSLAMACTVVAATTQGSISTVAYGALFGLMAALYPIIFVLSTENLGRHHHRATTMLIMSVVGGCVIPPIQGAIADRHSMQASVWIILPCFAVNAFFGGYVWRQKGFKFTRRAELAYLHSRALLRAAELGSSSVSPPGEEEEKKVEETRIEDVSLRV